jgi:hypothetical protein
MSRNRKRSRRITLLTLIIAAAAMLAMLGLVQALPECQDAKARAVHSQLPLAVNGLRCRFEPGGDGATASAAR